MIEEVTWRTMVFLLQEATSETAAEPKCRHVHIASVYQEAVTKLMTEAAQAYSDPHLPTQ